MKEWYPPHLGTILASDMKDVDSIDSMCILYMEYIMMYLQINILLYGIYNVVPVEKPLFYINNKRIILIGNYIFHYSYQNSNLIMDNDYFEDMNLAYIEYSKIFVVVYTNQRLRFVCNKCHMK